MEIKRIAFIYKKDCFYKLIRIAFTYKKNCFPAKGEKAFFFISTNQDPSEQEARCGI